jgi:3-hydroxybutyryl-CoA dehydrogenase
MKIVVSGDKVAFEQLKNSNPVADWQRVESAEDFGKYPDADVFFDLQPNKNQQVNIPGEIPVFVNSVAYILENSQQIRFNGWNGFLGNETWEIAGELTEKAQDALNFLHKKIIQTADEPGFISARIIAMIINEAYHAKEEQVSTESEIDTAMKLGTNYPQGPFEWAKNIGHQDIVDLLKQLSLKDKKYTPAPALVNAAQQS